MGDLPPPLTKNRQTLNSTYTIAHTTQYNKRNQSRIVKQSEFAESAAQ